MTTQQVADKFFEYMQVGAFDKIYAELYSENCVSKEAPGSDWQDAHGMAAIHEKGKNGMMVLQKCMVVQLDNL